MSTAPSILAVAVGNTRTRFGLFHGTELHHPRSLPNANLQELADAIAAIDTPDALVIATVNPPKADELEDSLKDRAGGTIWRMGRDVPIAINHRLSDDSTVGQDRLLNALGAYGRAQQACVVIDAGTAVTVDFIDGEGTFHGGAIAPGLQMMLDALHEKTAALPQVRYELPPPDDEPFGHNTRTAMVLGVTAACRGLVQHLVERYATAYDAYPQVVATGGDAAVLFEHPPAGQLFVEHIVPDLQLMGIQHACVRAMESGEAEIE